MKIFTDTFLIVCVFSLLYFLVFCNIYTYKVLLIVALVIVVVLHKSQRSTKVLSKMKYSSNISFHVRELTINIVINHCILKYNSIVQHRNRDSNNIK